MKQPPDTKGSGIHSKETERYLCFTLAGECYAISLLEVREVIALCNITPVPQTSPHFRGFINLRSEIISIIDLRLKLGMQLPPSECENAIIIIERASQQLGAIVDSIDCVLAVTREELSPPPEQEQSIPYVTAIIRREKQLTFILNTDAFLGEAARHGFNDIA